MSFQYIKQFTTNNALPTVSNLRPRPDAASDWLMNAYFDAFARIYYSSEAFDLGRPPAFAGSEENTYIKDAIRHMFVSVKDSRASLQDRAEAIHDAWSHNYLFWKLNRESDVVRNDSLLVPFAQLPAFEQKKRYFAADLVAYIMRDLPTCKEDDTFYASHCMDLATYYVAYTLVQRLSPNIPDVNTIIEMSEKDYLSSNLL
jgi:hypothetical protein